jgi:hypothetical protein
MATADSSLVDQALKWREKLLGKSKDCELSAFVEKIRENKVEIKYLFFAINGCRAPKTADKISSQKIGEMLADATRTKVALGDIKGIWEIRAVTRDNLMKLVSHINTSGFLPDESVLVVRIDRKNFLLIDGNHRVLALYIIGRGDLKQTIPAIVIPLYFALSPSILLAVIASQNIKHDGMTKLCSNIYDFSGL